MIGYAESNVFTAREVSLLRRATRLVESVGAHQAVIRCHELARAVSGVLDLPVEDGFYGHVEHSWLWTEPVDPTRPRSLTRVGFPNILDVYSVGQLPQVRLIDGRHPQLPHVGWAYRPTSPRTDIDQSFVEALVREMATAHG